ncbi:Processing alpha glucosidase I [Ascosphaera aggregata]|nr:Processing alpha glucosidase I [Ascosphaera aggregata]
MFPALLSIWVIIGLLSFGNYAAANDYSSSIIKDGAEAVSNSSLLWGPYRPNLYFGVRPRLPKTLMTGLLWAKVDDYDNPQANFRYTCEQNEGIHGYGWDEYDIRTGGRQSFHDTGNTIDLTIDFVKVPGGQHGGSWGARIKGVPTSDDAANQPTTVIFYASIEGLGHLELENEVDPLGYEGDVTIVGDAHGLGDFKIEITRGPESNSFVSHDHPAYEDRPLSRTIVSSMRAPAEMLWQAKTILFAQMRQVISNYLEEYGQENIPPAPQMFTIPNQSVEDGNLYFVQKTFRGGFEFDILFSSGSVGQALTSEVLTTKIQQTRSSFSKRFKEIFAPVAPYATAKYEEFSKSMFSNLVGGIGYFFGDSIVDRSYAPEYEEDNEGFWEETEAARARAVPQPEGDAELFTAIPSRPFFPRGFLWDEGFHLIPIMEWDLDLTLQITKSWFSLMDDDGWIAREQILGPEARSKVPAEFQVQYPHYANPPTLFLIINSLAEKVKAIDKSGSGSSSSNSKIETEDTIKDIRSIHLHNPDTLLTYLNSIYPLLKRQYFWFRKTQQGDLKSYDREAFSLVEGYRWRGRSVRHILVSGLDDYPRPQPPHPGELHLDLISWVGMMARSLSNIAEVLGIEDDIATFAKHETAILRNIEGLHWDEKEKMYCDATIDDYEEHVHVCHKGYISLFPFLTGLMDANHPHLGAVLELIADPEELWSPFGIRSLSKSDEFYGTDENYWRGPIWINMNYLVLKNMLDIARAEGPHREKARKIYNDLRRALVDTVFKSWKETGFAWEQYNPEDGHGQRTQHFTGWTSLVVKIMAMPNLGEQENVAAKSMERDEL